jgi:hypothetical protein
MTFPVFAPALIACAAALSCLPGIALGAWTVYCHRRKVASEFTRLQLLVETGQESCTRAIGGLAAEFQLLATELQRDGDGLQGGQLSRTHRAQALQLLRAGIPPENAAETVGLPVREMRLLSKIARLLSHSSPAS